MIIYLLEIANLPSLYIFVLVIYCYGDKLCLAKAASGKRAYFGSQFHVQSVMARQSLWQELEIAGHFVCAVRK